MKKKTEKEISPREMAEYLEQMAARLKSGSFEVEGRQWSVPAKLNAKIKH
jgi:hypothetical protein